MSVVSIGLTGGIGCGKSSVAKILEDAGWRRLDTDRVAREVVAPKTRGLLSLVELFGQEILLPNGELDRAALGAIVFGDPQQRKKLEAVLHPLIWSEVREFLAGCKEAGLPCVVEVPLLFENERQSTFSTVWVVTTSKDLQFQRLRERNAWTDQEIEARISSQMPLSVKEEKADVVIKNVGDFQALKTTTLRLAQETLEDQSP